MMIGNCGFQFSIDSILDILFKHTSEKTKASAALVLHSYIFKYQRKRINMFIIENYCEISYGILIHKEKNHYGTAPKWNRASFNR